MTEPEKSEAIKAALCLHQRSAIKAERLRIRRAIAEELRDSRAWLRLCKRGELTETKRLLIHEFTGEILSLRSIAKIIGK